MVIVTLNIDNYDICHILIDSENFINILFYDTFSKMNVTSNRLAKFDSPLVGFSRDAVPIEGVVILSVIAGRPP